MQLDIEKKLIITVGGFILIAIIVALTIILPTIKQIADINKNTQQVRMYMEKKHNGIMGLRNAKIKAREIKEEVFSFVNYFYYPEQELKLITQLESISTNNKVTQNINGYEIKDGTAKLSLNIIGDYNDTLNYLSELENIDYFIRINFLHLTQEQDRNTKTPVTKINLELSIYVNTK